LRKTQKTHTLIPKNDVTEPKARLLSVELLTGYKSVSDFRKPKLKLFFNLLTAF